MSNQGYYGGQPQQGYGGPPQQGYGGQPQYPQQAYGAPQQGGYYPQQQPPMGYQQQPAPKASGGAGKGCLGACLAALCCCCVAEEGCEACADCKFPYSQISLPMLTKDQVLNVAKCARRVT